MSETSAQANERRSHNRKLALAYAKAGIAIHLVLNKAPLFKAYQRLDTGLNAAERAELTEDFRQDHDGREPVHVGSTKDPKVIREVLKRFPDAIPAICGGPNGLLMLDVDFDPNKGKNGPEKIEKWLAEKGESIPEGCPITTTQGGGEHVFFKDEAGLGNHEGLFSQLDTNVRGSAGYVVAPGSQREDGKVYLSKFGTPSLMYAFAAGVIPPVPDFIVEAIKTSVVRSENVGDGDIAAVRRQLQRAELPDYDDLTDELDGEFDLKGIARKNPHFAAVVEYDEAEDDGSHDFSAARMTFCNVLAHEYGDKLTPEALLALIEGTPGCGVLVDKAPGKLEKGEFNLRNVARDYLRAVGKEKEDAARAERLSGLLVAAADDDDYGRDAPPEAHETNGAHGKADDLIAALLAKPLPSLSLADIPDIPFVVPDIAARGYATAAVGPGGASKSQYLLQVALAVVTGRLEIAGLTPDPEFQRGNVWFHNQEDDDTMNQRRLAAVCEKFGVPREEIDGSKGNRLWFTSGADHPILIAARSQQTGEIVKTKLVKPIIAHIKALDICLLLMDPMSELHTAKENLNEEIGVPWRTVRYIAQQANCAAIVAAHTRKPDKAGSDGYAGVIDAMRGGSAQVGVIRSSFTVYTLGEEEAKAYGISEEDRRDYACVVGSKSNISRIEGKTIGIFKRTSTVASATGKSTVGVLVKVDLKTADNKGKQATTRETTALLSGQQQEVMAQVNKLLVGAVDASVHLSKVLEAVNADRAASAGDGKADEMSIKTLRVQLERLVGKQMIERDDAWNVRLKPSKYAVVDDEDDEAG